MFSLNHFKSCLNNCRSYKFFDNVFFLSIQREFHLTGGYMKTLYTGNFVHRGNTNWTEKIYLVAFVCVLTAFFLKSTLFIPGRISYFFLYKLIQAASILAVIKSLFIEQKLTKEKICYLAGLTCLFGLSFLANNFDLFYYFLFALSASRVDFHKIVVVFFGVNFWGTLIVIFAEWINFIPNQVQFRPDQPGLIRYSMGFSSPTDFSARIFYIILSYMLLKKFSLKFYDYLGIMLSTLVMYVLTNARLDGLLIFLLLICTWVYPFVKVSINKVSHLFWYASSVIFICANILIAFFYDPANKILNRIDVILSRRLTFGHAALTRYKLGLVGKPIQEFGNGGLHPNPQNYFFIDSSYIRLLVMSGIIVFLIVLVLLYFIFFRIKLTQSTFFLIYVFFIILSSAFDQYFLDLSYNLLFFLLFADLNWFISNQMSERKENSKNSTSD